MNDARTAPRTDPRRPVRSRRRTDGLVAQYIHELSDRHAATRRAALGESTEAAGRPDAPRDWPS